jgi:putative endonuclease
MKLKPAPRPFRVSLGDRGEMAGWDYLRKQGYHLIEKNYRSRFGEIDVVAEKNGRLVFIEIKTRRTAGRGLPQEAVDAAKQRRLVRLAAAYIRDKKLDGKPVSFAVLSIVWGKELVMRLIENAFEAGDGSWTA